MARVERPELQRIDIALEIDKIFRERMPNPEEVLFAPVVEFLDPEGKLTREERCKAVAMGDRTARSYKSLEADVIRSRDGGPVLVDGEWMDATTAFFLRYALVARGRKEIAHTSVLEQVGIGPEEYGGDPPIVMEGITGLVGYRDICALRHFAFEAFSTRGALVPEGYWAVPRVLYAAGVGEKLEAINRQVHRIYIILTRGGIVHYLRELKRGAGEKAWEYRWRILSSALDDARQVSNQSWLCHLSIHPNSAQALREGVVRLASSEYPETREVAGRLRGLAKAGLPTLMRHTEASEYRMRLPEKARKIAYELGLLGGNNVSQEERLRFVGFWVSGVEAERVFLASIVASKNDVSFDRALERIHNLSDVQLDSYLELVLGDMDFHDSPPDEMDMIQLNTSFVMSVGAIYEFIRHRLVTHIVSEFTVNHGYTMPAVYEELGLADLYRQAMDLNAEGYGLIDRLGSEYAVYKPLFVARGHLVHNTARVSGADVFHILKLRADKGAHPDLRDPMYQLEAALRREMPTIFRHLIKK